MGKRVQFDDAARHALWRGVDQLASAVRVTLGPRGRSVVLGRRDGVPTITRDGIAVATEVELADPFENLGVQMLREAALRTGQQAGDGTTTSTVLAHRIVGEGMLAVAQGHRPAVLQRGLERGFLAFEKRLAALAQPVRERRELLRVATLAAGDRRLGERVAEAFERVGHHGVIAVEDGHRPETVLEVVEGVRFEGGYASPYFVTDAEEMECALDHPLVLLADARLTEAREIVPALEAAARQSRPLCVVAEAIEGEALAVLVINRLRGRAATAGVQVAGTAQRRRECLEDLGLLTGASLVAEDMGRDAAHLRPEWLGRARHLAVGAQHTMLRQGGGRSSELAAAVDATRHMLGSARGEAEVAALRARLARLAGGIAVLEVGATTEVERHATRSRLEDAIAATRAALEHGVVPGGGATLLRLADEMRRDAPAERERPGRELLLRALEEPLRTIAVNAGAEPAAVVSEVRRRPAGEGFNALTLGYGDLRAEGVLDPVCVVRAALANAVSVAGLVLSTDALVVDDGEDPRAA